jgi:predicted nucleic acid-binding Zn ribbon protein
MEDKFFTKNNCDRCGKKLDARTMSWFTDETICMTCSDKETEIKKKLSDGGKNYEGCGYIPEINKREVNNENS